MREVIQIQPDQIKFYAEQMRPLIEKIARRFHDGAFTYYGVLEKFMRGEWTCLAMFDDEGKIDVLGATATYPDMNGNLVVQIMFIVGRTGILEEIMEAEEWITEQCRKHGVFCIEFLGREGWLPKMRKLGYDTGIRLYRKELH